MSKRAELIKNYAKEQLELPFDLSMETEVRIGVSKSGLLEVIMYQKGKPDRVIFQVGAWEGDIFLSGYAGLYMVSPDNFKPHDENTHKEMFVKFQKGFAT